MGINRLSQSSTVASWTAPFRLPIRALARWLSRGHTDPSHALPMATARAPVASLAKTAPVIGRPAFAVTASACTPAASRPGCGHRRLKVLREPDPLRRGSAGRMVISGRMADVCAELDRMARSETERRVTHNAVRPGSH